MRVVAKPVCTSSSIMFTSQHQYGLREIALSTPASRGRNFEIGRREISNPKSRNLKLDWYSQPSRVEQDKQSRVYWQSNLKFRDFGFEISLRPISKFLPLLAGVDNAISRRPY